MGIILGDTRSSGYSSYLPLSELIVKFEGGPASGRFEPAKHPLDRPTPRQKKKHSSGGLPNFLWCV